MPCLDGFDRVGVLHVHLDGRAPSGERNERPGEYHANPVRDHGRLLWNLEVVFIRRRNVTRRFSEVQSGGVTPGHIGADQSAP